VTKPGFSFGDAIGAPFVLIRRRPLAVFVWGSLMIAMMAAIYSLILPAFLSLPLEAGAEKAWNAYTVEMLQLQALSNGLSLLMYLVLLVIFNAAGRAMLSPGVRDPFLFMRLGMDEVRVAVVVVGTFLGWYIALLVLILLGVAIGFAVWSLGEATAIAIIIGYSVLALIATLVGWARISLMGPATLILRRFAFAEGWVIGRGQVLKLIAMHLVVWLLYMLTYLVVIVVVGAILIGGFLGQGLIWPDAIATPRDLLPIVRSMAVPLLATLPVLAFAYGVFIALMAAPSIRAARQLLDGVPAAPVPTDVPAPDTLQTA
jgi:hypothetical protein